LLMTTIRSHDQFNTTIYSQDDRYRGIYGNRRVILMNAADIEALGWQNGGVVDLVSCYEGQERRAPGFTIVAYPIPRGSTATYFPEANVLVPVGEVAERSNTPASKSIVIRLAAPGEPVADYIADSSRSSNE
jgi:anaerobic selenocysteine-containing dehydrogenase